MLQFQRSAKFLLKIKRKSWFRKGYPLLIFVKNHKTTHSFSKCVVKIQYNPWNNVCGDLLLWSFSSMKNVKSVHLKILKQIANMASRYEMCGNLLLWSFSSIKNVKSVHLKTLKQIVTMAFRYEVCGNLLLWPFTLIKNVKWSNFKDQQKFC